MWKDPKTIRELLERNVADYKRPRDIRFIDSMPINPTGKVDKRSLKVQHLEGKQSAGSRS